LIVNGVTIPLVGTYDELWFPAKELCMVMEYKDTKNALFHNVKPRQKTTLDKLKKLVGAHPTNFLWPFSEELSYHAEKTVYISEYGVTILLLPIGEKFRDWLAEEVVPSIRRTGQYKLKESFNLQLAIKDEQLAITEEYIANQEEHITRLCEKVAVMTIRNETNHVFQLYKHRSANEYIFIRTQARRLPEAIKVANLEKYELLLNEINVPNAMNILNRLKEKLRKQKIFFRASNNKLTVDTDISEMVRELIQGSLQ